MHALIPIYPRTAIGLRVKDGIVLAVEKLVHSKLLVPDSNRRIQTIDRNVGMVRSEPHTSSMSFKLTTRILQATSGLLADGRQIANRARDEAYSYRDLYKESPPLKELVQRMGLYVQAYTLYSSVRPFGCSTILGAIDKSGPVLYIIEPSGVAYVRTILEIHVNQY